MPMGEGVSPSLTSDWILTINPVLHVNETVIYASHSGQVPGQHNASMCTHNAGIESRGQLPLA